MKAKQVKALVAKLEQKYGIKFAKVDCRRCIFHVEYKGTRHLGHFWKAISAQQFLEAVVAAVKYGRHIEVAA